MRIALVSPYSWTYPGGVTRHIDALRRALAARGHEVKVLSPFDPPGRRTELRHRGARPQARPLEPWLVSLGGTFGWPSNGAVSNLAFSPTAVSALRSALHAGEFDVVHLHEPVAPVVGWDALTALPVELPLVGTFHCHSESWPPHAIAAFIGARRKLNRLRVRIAVSEAAAWTGRRFYGGEYRIVPNGVELPARGVAPPRPRPAGEPLRLAFVGQSVERKGLPVLLRAFEALREAGAAVRLDVVGVDRDELAPLQLDTSDVIAHGRLDEAGKQAVLESAHVLVAPSLGGESFGMVLTEGMAAGTAVVASDIAGYRDVAGTQLLVPPGDPVALGEALRDLALDEPRRFALASAAAAGAPRYAWSHVAEEVEQAYTDAIAIGAPSRRRGTAVASAPAGAFSATAPARRAAAAERAPIPHALGLPVPQVLLPRVAGGGARAERAAIALGLRPASRGPRVPARRLPAPDPLRAARRGHPVLRAVRKLGLVGAGIGAAGLTFLALQRIGVDSVVESLLRSSPAWVLFGLALMCSSMLLRAVAWHAILRAALQPLRVRLADAVQGTCIGVLMSATLPARLGEPARALIVARRVGRPREALPAVTGSVVAQTLLNLVALVILGTVMFMTVGLFAGRQQALVVYAVAPVAIVLAVIVAPALLRSGGRLQAVRRVRAWMADVRGGLTVFRVPKLGAIASSAQLGAWAIQWLSCFVLLVALGLEDRAGLGAAAAVLFAVNVSAVLPLTPSNLGVFQAACVAVLTGAYGVGAADALGYGIVLQAVEIATAFVMGMPALVKEGVSWREIRLRALHTSPVTLRPVANER